jgi:hypothetical protein
MLTIEELELACDASQLLEPSKHMLDAPELGFVKTFYPLGFPATVRTDSKDVLDLYGSLWGKFQKQYGTEPIRIAVQLVESDSSECPPAPSYRIMLPLMMCVADQDNYSIVNLDSCETNIVVSRASLRFPLYAQYFFLSTPGCCISTRLTTPVHAACVALDGRGVLLCGDSGSGKSTLAYACARAGWTYVSDDGSYLLNGGSKRIVTGDCHQVRFRPSASELFPELQGLEITPRAAGKPSIELPTAGMPNIECAQSTRVDFIVFLNRRAGGAPQLVPYRKDVARPYMRQTIFGSPESLAPQYEAIDRLLTAGVFELRYSDLDWATDRLRALVREGK